MIKEETARAQPATRASTCEWRHQGSEFVYASKGNVPDYVRRGGATYRVLSDQLGSPRYVVNVANAADVPFTASYTSFGQVTGTGLDWMPFGLAGGIYDGDSGLVRFGARDMEPTVGRWVSKDPIRFRGGNNLYVYATNDPMSYVDESGRQVIGNDPCDTCKENFKEQVLECTDACDRDPPGGLPAAASPRRVQCIEDCEDAYEPQLKECLKHCHDGERPCQ